MEFKIKEVSKNLLDTSSDIKKIQIVDKYGY